MILVYKPTEGDEQRWDLADVKATFAEAKAAERAGNFQWIRMNEELAEGNIEVLQAVLWVLRKRTEPTLTLADLDALPMDAATVEYGEDEKAAMRAHIASNPDLSDEQKAAALELLSDTPEEDEAPAPKAKAASKR